jgi:DNA-binding cell septation regulator SpoVG
MSFAIPSDTLRRQIYKRLTHKYLCDVRQDIKDSIASEINSRLDEESRQDKHE